MSEVSPERIRRFLAEKRTPVDVGRLGADSLCIVVPVYGHARFIGRAIESISRQSVPPDEVIFVDDRSGDGSRRVITRSVSGLRSRHRTIVNARNMGQAASLNAGIGASDSDLVMVLNDDDYLFPYAVEAMLELFARHPRVALMGATCRPFRNDAVLRSAERTVDLDRLRLTFRSPVDASGYRRYNDVSMTHSGSTFYRAAWRSVGGYRPRRGRIVPFSDRDFQIRVNLLYEVAVSYGVPFSFWRTDSSVDRGLNS